MNASRFLLIFIMVTALLLSWTYRTQAAVSSFCPATITDPVTGRTDVPDIACKHVTGGDGFIKMGDYDPLNPSAMYIFGFSDVTGISDDLVMDAGMLGAEFSAPTLVVNEGDEFYLNLTNVGMTMRPDLFDPHTVHFHGFPNASSVFDGEPMASISINMGNTLTYYYNIVEPGTYMYHCHVEATEHMQMGMLGNLYVRPAQDGTNVGVPETTYAYNDCPSLPATTDPMCGSTGYDVDFPLQITSMDPLFHEADLTIQPLPFANMTDVYPMINGRGYPDTKINADLDPPVLPDGPTGKVSQRVPSLVTASAGQKILLRISSLATVDFYTITVLGIPMKVVGKDARLLRGPTGQDTSYITNSITLGGGESADVILDTTGVSPGTYFLYTTNVNQLSNNTEDFGGMMTEIVLN